MYTVFADFHHAGLLNSLILLFEERLGGSLFRPIGMEWAELGYWKVFDHPATRAQYLAIGGETPDNSQPLNEVVEEVSISGKEKAQLYYCQDIDCGQINKAITLDGFMSMKFDFVIASLPQHIKSFRQLVNQHPDHPKLLYQVGNSWNITAEQAQYLDGVLASSKMPLGISVNGANGKPLPVVEYHQEFDAELFSPSTEEHLDFLANHGKMISSFVNCFSVDQMFAQDWQLFQEVEKLMPEWEFYARGGQCRDGAAHGARQVAMSMTDSKFIWHTKRGGDGYGHIIHNAFACGKPPIVKFSDYEGKMAGSMMVDGITAINIDNLSAQEIVQKILLFSEPDRYKIISREARKMFEFTVNFEKEALSIKQMLSNLL